MIAILSPKQILPKWKEIFNVESFPINENIYQASYGLQDEMRNVAKFFMYLEHNSWYCFLNVYTFNDLKVRASEQTYFCQIKQNTNIVLGGMWI